MINDAINNQVKLYDFYVRHGHAARLSERLYWDAPNKWEQVRAHTIGMTNVLQGDCYSIERPIMQLLEEAGTTVPDWTLHETDLPSRAGFVWFDRPLRVAETIIDEKTGEWEQATWYGLGWSVATEERTGQRGIMVYLIEQIDTHLRENPDWPPGMFPVSRFWWYGERLTEHVESGRYRKDDPVDFHGDPYSRDLDAEKRWIARALRTLVALLAFLQQDLIRITRQRPGRAERKRLAKAMPKHSGEINVIALRRVHYVGRETDEEKKVEWSCQWLVKGHWHHYWYKREDGTQELRPRWLTPYVKGPEDKPLKTPTATVFEVKR